MLIMLFVNDDCAACPDAVAACEGFDELEVVDLAHVEGRAEAAVHSVSTAPSVLVLDNDGREVAGWRGSVPDRESLRSLVSN